MAKSLEKFGGVPAGGTTGQALVKTSGTDNDVEWGTGGGGVAVNDIEDATGATAIDCGSNNFTLSAFGKSIIDVSDSATVTYVTHGGSSITIGGSSTGSVLLSTSTGGYVTIGAAASSVGFYGAAGSVIQVVPDGTMDGAIAALSFSDPPTQAECAALRDACETLRDEITAIRQALYNLNAISPV